MRLVFIQLTAVLLFSLPAFSQCNPGNMQNQVRQQMQQSVEQMTNMISRPGEIPSVQDLQEMMNSPMEMAGTMMQGCAQQNQAMQQFQQMSNIFANMNNGNGVAGAFGVNPDQQLQQMQGQIAGQLQQAMGQMGMGNQMGQMMQQMQGIMGQGMGMMGSFGGQ